MVDAHCHLYDIPDLDTELQRCKDSKINIIICNGAGDKTNKQALEIANKFEFVYATAGYHPEEVVSYQLPVINELESFIVNNKNIVAVGECGLDYYEKTSDEEKAWQRQVFKLQVELAKKLALPLVVHCRNAFSDVFKLVDYDRVQMHCFTGNQEQMEECVRRGWYISVGGIITFKNDGGLLEVIKKVPVDRLLTETDAPWLSPEPFRGQKNKPSRVKFILEQLGVDLESKIEENTRRLFNL